MSEITLGVLVGAFTFVLVGLLLVHFRSPPANSCAARHNVVLCEIRP